MSLPRIAARDEWLAARKELLAKEKEQTRQRDALNAERRGLPMVEIEKEYRLAGPDGSVRLIDLFESRRQLIVYRFMFDPAWEDGCSSCTAGTDELSPGFLAHPPHPTSGLDGPPHVATGRGADEGPLRTDIERWRYRKVVVTSPS